MKNKSLTTPGVLKKKKGILQLHVFLYFQTVVVLLLPNFVQSNCSPGHLLLRLLEQRKKALKKMSRCCITGTSSLAKHSAVRQRSCLFTKPHNSSRLASPWGGCWWRQVSAGVMAAGGGAAHAAGQIRSSTEEDRGKWGRGRWRHCKGLEVDLLRPTRCGPSEDVLNLLSTFVLRPRQGGWKWGEGWRGGHKSAPFRLKTGFKSHFKDTSSLNQKRSKLKKKKSEMNSSRWVLPQILNVDSGVDGKLSVLWAWLLCSGLKKVFVLRGRRLKSMLCRLFKRA